MTRLSNDQVIRYTVAAMEPYYCACEFRDYNMKFGYAVYFSDDDENDDRSVNENLPRRVVTDVALLEGLLLTHRKELESQHGLKFNTWDGIPAQTDC